MATQTRLRYFNALVGVTGSGKSNFAAQICKRYQQNIIVVKHIVNIDDPAFSFLPEKNTENFKKYATPGAAIQCKIAFKGKPEYKELLKWLMDNFRNGLLVIDDTTIIEKDRMTELLQELVTMRRHYGIDIIVIYHGLTYFPIDQFIHLNHLVFFNTTDNFQYKINKLPNAKTLIAAALQARENFKSAEVKKKYTPVILNVRELQ